MRDASGNLVEVRVREPWALHLLTSDGTNDVADVEAIKAPAEPGLVQLAPVGVEMLAERYDSQFPGRLACYRKMEPTVAWVA